MITKLKKSRIKKWQALSLVLAFLFMTAVVFPIDKVDAAKKEIFTNNGLTHARSSNLNDSDGGTVHPSGQDSNTPEETSPINGIYDFNGNNGQNGFSNDRNGDGNGNGGKKVTEPSPDTDPVVSADLVIDTNPDQLGKPGDIPSDNPGNSTNASGDSPSTGADNGQANSLNGGQGRGAGPSESELSGAQTTAGGPTALPHAGAGDLPTIVTGLMLLGAGISARRFVR